MPLYFDVQAARNTGASNQGNAAIGSLNLGAIRDRGDLRFLYQLAFKQANSLISQFTDDDLGTGSGVNILGFVPAQSIERVVSYARSKGIERFAALIPAGSVYGQRAATTYVRAVNESGGRVIAMQSYTRNAGSITAAVKKLTGASGKAVAGRSAEAGTSGGDGTAAPVAACSSVAM